jgi:4-phospho-D-threonate 3-dehydrogenase / 4-phospho-D-erythronate 3-dehydrogenase
MRKPNDRPILAITMGDPAGVGPEIAVRALYDPATYRICRPLVIGDGSVMKAAVEGIGI